MFPELIATISQESITPARSDQGMKSFPRLVQSKEGKEFVEEMAEKRCGRGRSRTSCVFHCNGSQAADHVRRSGYQEE